MAKYGETPAVQAPPKKESSAADSTTENAPKKKAMDPKKQALLEKRKKYDPRAAIKNSKKPSTVVEPTSTVEPSQGDHLESAMAFAAPPKIMQEQPVTETDDPEGEAPKDPNMPARPFLKSKTKAVKLDKSQTKYKPQGKSKIDCWQKEGTGNTNLIVGGKQVSKPKHR